MNKVKLSKMTLASAAATILLAGCGGEKMAKNDVSSAVAKVADVKCSGINTCKGTSACATATSSCHGQNKCKGQGWIKVTKEACEAKGGKILS